MASPLAWSFRRQIPFSFARMIVRKEDRSALGIEKLVRRIGETLVSDGWRGPEHLQNAQFFTGGRIKRHGEEDIITKSGSLTVDGKIRRLWAMENVERSGTSLRRMQWRVRVGIEEIDEGTCALAVQRLYAHGFVAPEHDVPPEIPGGLWDLIRTPDLVFATGGERLLGTPTFIGSDLTVQQFVEHLSASDRATAVLVRNDTAIDTMQLVRDVAGHANVFSASSSATERILEKVLARQLDEIWDEGLIYVPGVPMERHISSVLQLSMAWGDHARYIRGSTDADSGFIEYEDVFGPITAKDVLRAIVANVFHFGPWPDGRTLVAPADVVDRVRHAEIKSLRASRRDNEELLRLFEEENDALHHRLPAAEGEADRLRNALEAAAAREDALRHEINGVKARLLALSNSRGLSAPASVDLPSLPDTLLDVVDLACRLYAHAIHATELARASSLDANFRDVGRAWTCIHRMATVLHRLHFGDALPFREIAKRFQNETGFELAVHESESTRNNARLAALRQQLYKGESLDFSAHVKGSNRKGHSLRIHYAPHAGERRIIIGHFGDHLPTGGGR